MLRKLGIAAAMLAVATTADAAVITFDLAVNLADPNYSPSNVGTVTDQSGFYTMTLQGVADGSGLVAANHTVVRNAIGAGIRVTSQADTDYIEWDGLNERLRFNLGSNSFQLVGLTIAVPAGYTRPTPLWVYTGGQGDVTFDYSNLLQAGATALELESFSSTFDLTSGSATGFMIRSISFETGMPLPTPPSSSVPEPTTALLVGMGALGLAGSRLRRSRRV